MGYYYTTTERMKYKFKSRSRKEINRVRGVTEASEAAIRIYTRLIAETHSRRLSAVVQLRGVSFSFDIDA